jgi:hypothetical protein
MAELAAADANFNRRVPPDRTLELADGQIAAERALLDAAAAHARGLERDPTNEPKVAAPAFSEGCSVFGLVDQEVDVDAMSSSRAPLSSVRQPLRIRFAQELRRIEASQALRLLRRDELEAGRS